MCRSIAFREDLWSKKVSAPVEEAKGRERELD